MDAETQWASPAEDMDMLVDAGGLPWPNHRSFRLWTNRSEAAPHPLRGATHNVGDLPDVHSSRLHILACVSGIEAWHRMTSGD